MKILYLILISILICVVCGEEDFSNKEIEKPNKRDVDFSDLKDLSDFDRLKNLVGNNLDKIKNVTDEGMEWLKSKFDSKTIAETLKKLIPDSILDDLTNGKNANKDDSNKKNGDETGN